MDVIDLLKQVGLTQYEAEAYTTLLREGALTGYELGKRSKVALPRIYDVLERLQRRGLALVQPGDPPRYRAEDPAIYIRQLRTGMAARLHELEAQLLALPTPGLGEEFWVIRGHDQIRGRTTAMIESAEHSIGLRLPRVLERDLAGVVAGARRRCRVLPIDVDIGVQGNEILVLVDDRELLAGTLDAPAQAVVSRNRALTGLARTRSASDARTQVASPAPAETETDWLVWEADKQRRLRLLTGGSDVA